MKKLSYQKAVLSYCPDLTNPSEKAIPLGIMLVGEVGAERVAGIAFYLPKALAAILDPISREMLDDVPGMLKRHIDQAAASREGAAASIESILQKLHHDLRNSLSVASIQPTQERELDDDEVETLYGAVTSALVEALNEDLGVPASVPPSARPVAARPRRVPEVSMWQLGSAEAHA